MPRSITVIIFIFIITVAGLGAYKAFDYMIAAYLVSCIGSAAALSAVFIQPKNKRELNSKIRIGKSVNSNVVGISDSTEKDADKIKSDINIDDIRGGKLTGVDLKQADDEVDN